MSTLVPIECVSNPPTIQIGDGAGSFAPLTLDEQVYIYSDGWFLTDYRQWWMLAANLNTIWGEVVGAGQGDLFDEGGGSGNGTWGLV